MTMQVGITGGIGSGKTMICRILKTLGVPVYPADERARWLMNEDAGLRKRISELLGPEAYRSGELDSDYVAGQVFPDERKLNQLNAVVHPVVRRDYEKWLREREGNLYVVEEAAILFESGAHRWMDVTVLVYAPVHTRVRRVMERDGVREEDVRMRMERQMDEEEKRKMADRVIVNDSHHMLLPQVVGLHEELIQIAKGNGKIR